MARSSATRETNVAAARQRLCAPLRLEIGRIAPAAGGGCGRVFLDFQPAFSPDDRLAYYAGAPRTLPRRRCHKAH